MTQPEVSDVITTGTLQLQFDCQNTLKGLAGSAIACPPVSLELIQPYFAYLNAQGLLAPPTKVLEAAIN